MSTVAIADACARARYADMQGRRPYDEILHELLDDVERAIGVQSAQPDQRLFDETCRAVSEAFGIPVSNLIGPRRTQRYCRARRALCRLLNLQGMSMREIGQRIGRTLQAVHSSVHGGMALLDTDNDFRRRYLQAMGELRLDPQAPSTIDHQPSTARRAS